MNIRNLDEKIKEIIVREHKGTAICDINPKITRGKGTEKKVIGSAARGSAAHIRERVKQDEKQEKTKQSKKVYWLVTGFLAVFGAFFLVDIIPAFALPWVILSMFIIVALQFSQKLLLKLGKAI